MKFSVSLTETSIVFVNTKTDKAEKLELFEVMDDGDAVQALNKENKARESASKASVSLLSHLLNNPRLDGYKGQTPINENLPKELKAAVRDLEVEFFRPLVCGPLAEKGAKPEQQEKQFQSFMGCLREGGSYAHSKARVLKYFAVCGSLPIADNGKLLSVAAIEKLLENIDKPEPEHTGISGKLVKLSAELEARTEKTVLGSLPEGIAAMKSMLATFEGLYREELERTTALKGNSAATQAQAAVSKASKASKGEAQPA